jgi:hypothetical protein
MCSPTATQTPSRQRCLTMLPGDCCSRVSALLANVFLAKGVIGVILAGVRSAARTQGEALLGPFEKTIRYHGQVGVRAAKTRKKKAEQAAGDEAPPPKPE